MGVRSHIFGSRSREREAELGDALEMDSCIYAAGGWVIWEMTPALADELACHVLPALDDGFEDDSKDLLEASYYAKGNSPEAKELTPPEEMSINEAQAWKEGMGVGMYISGLLERDINPFRKEDNGT